MAQISGSTTITVSLVCTVLVTIATLFNVSSNRKQRREVNFAFEPASKTEFSEFVAANKHEHEILFGKISTVERSQLARCDGNMTGLRAEIKADLHSLHNRINEILAAVSEIRGELKGLIK